MKHSCLVVAIAAAFVAGCAGQQLPIATWGAAPANSVTAERSSMSGHAPGEHDLLRIAKGFVSVPLVQFATTRVRSLCGGSTYEDFI